MNICAFTSVCAEDERWVQQYLAEAERLLMPFVIHFDRCHITRMASHPLCVSVTQQPNENIEFNETHKQQPLNALVSLRRYDWAMAWDIDETWEKYAPQKIEQLDKYSINDVVEGRWVNLWETPNQVRTDGPFSVNYRNKFYNLTKGRRWKFRHKIVNGAYLSLRDAMAVRYDIVCLHWGLMTHDLRQQHKQRWDRIYTRAGGRNPYGIWNHALDTNTYPPQTEPNPYL